MNREITALVTFTVDDDEWEGAGYDPLSSDDDQAAQQVAGWIGHMAYVGPDHVPARVHEIYPGQPRPSAQVSHDQHVVSLTTDGERVNARATDGELLASFPRPDRLLVAGDKNDQTYHRALEVALVHIGRQSPID